MSTCLVSGTLKDPSESAITGATVTYNIQSPYLSGTSLLGPKAVSTETGWSFTITSGSATSGAVYTNNGNSFTVVTTIASALLLQTTGTGSPTTSGTLTLSSGTGDATLTFSAYTAGTWQLPLSQGSSGIVTIDCPASSLDSTNKYSFSVVVPSTATANFSTIWDNS